MNTKKLTFSAMCVVVNLVLGTVMGMIQIPLLFLDTIGTILGAVVLGPLWGALIGGCSNLVLGVISDPTNIPFAIVNIATGLIVGFMAKKETLVRKSYHNRYHTCCSLSYDRNTYISLYVRWT